VPENIEVEINRTVADVTAAEVRDESLAELVK
jgi:hypothetical protein